MYCLGKGKWGDRMQFDWPRFDRCGAVKVKDSLTPGLIS